jgi:SpoVK/Ycf46/Vps4 family AAA+-type ATPase
MVRELFQMARSKKACIIFFDEVDAIGGARFDDGSGARHARALGPVLGGLCWGCRRGRLPGGRLPQQCWGWCGAGRQGRPLVAGGRRCGWWGRVGGGPSAAATLPRPALPCAGGDNEVQRTMLEIVNQLDGFDSRGNIKVRRAEGGGRVLLWAVQGCAGGPWARRAGAWG